MNFRADDTLAGHDRAAVDLRTYMIDYHRNPLATQYLLAFLDTRPARNDPDYDETVVPAALNTMRAITATPWQLGEPHVIAPTMTAIVAAAAALTRPGHGGPASQSGTPQPAQVKGDAPRAAT